MTDALTGATALWKELAAVPVDFQSGRVTLAVSHGSRWCPRGWVGVVRLGDATAVTVGDEDAAERVRQLELDVDSLKRHGVTRLLGPARLDYLNRSDFSPVHHESAVETSASDAPDLAALITDAGDDAAESGVDDIDSPAFVLRLDGRIVAAAGYARWPTSVAHLSVLSHPAYRGRGLAAPVASAATDHALNAGLLPQWRARIAPSQRVATRLGFDAVGEQLSFQLPD